MPGGILVIGVGGCGRGIVNQVKWRLNDLYGSAAKAGAVLYVIDGPQADQLNEGPRGYQIDVSPNSPEKFDFSVSPKPTIDSIQAGNRINFISDWLSAQEAKDTPKEGIEPRDGFGGMRVPGRTTAFLEAQALNNAITKLKGAANQCLTLAMDQGAYQEALNAIKMKVASLTVFICGSQSGGTGAGLLIDVAHLVRHNLGDKGRLIGVIALPSAFAHLRDGAEHVRLIANGMAGLRDLARSQTKDVPFAVTYDASLSVANQQLFHMCYLVDGGNTYRDGDPRQYLYPGAADLILAHVQDRKSIYVSLINRSAQVEVQPSACTRFSAYGIHEFVYSFRDVAETFRYRFVQDVAHYALEKRPGDPFDGMTKARTFLQGCCKFTELATKLDTKEGIPVAPPPEQNQYDPLGKSLELSAKGGRCKWLPCPNMPERVQKAGLIFNRVTNGIVQRNAETLFDRFIGKPASTDDCLINWLRNQQNLVVEEFEARLIDQVVDLFCTEERGKRKPKRWADEPGVITKAAEFAESVRVCLERLRGAIDQAYTQFATVDGVARSLHAKSKLDAILAKLDPNGVDRDKQENYLHEATKYLQVRMWELFIEAAHEIASRLLISVKSLLSKLGEEASGWANMLNAAETEAQHERSERIALREDLRGILTRTYFPAPDGAAEDALYADIVTTPHLGAYLGQCGWSVVCEIVGESDLNRVANFQIFAQMPEVEGFKTPTTSRKVRFLHNNTVGALPTEDFVWRRIGAYIVEKALPVLEDRSIWDILALDFEHVAYDRERGDEQKQRLEYVKSKCDILCGGGSAYQLQVSQQGRCGRSQYCMSTFLNVGTSSNPGDMLASEFAAELQSRNIKTEVNPSHSHQILLLNLDDGVDLRDWSFLKKGQQVYYDYLRKEKMPPISLCPQEKLAVQIEEDLARLARADYPQWLSPETVAMFRTSGEFQAIVLSYAFGLLERGRNRWEGAVMPLNSLGVQMPEGEVEWIAPEWQWGEIFRKLMYVQGQRPLCNAVVESWKNYYDTRLLAELKTAADVAACFNKHADELKLAEVPATFRNTHPDFLDHTELLAVFRSVLRQYTKGTCDSM